MTALIPKDISHEQTWRIDLLPWKLLDESVPLYKADAISP